MYFRQVELEPDNCCDNAQIDVNGAIKNVLKLEIT